VNMATTPRKSTPRKAPAARAKVAAAAPLADAPAEVILDLDSLEKSDYVPDAVLEPFIFRHAGKLWELADPRDLDWRDLMNGLRNPAAFMGMAMSAKQQEEFLEQPCPGWKMDAIFTNWQQHFKVTGLGDLNGLLAS
jgi:hypothetical protein